MRPEGWYGLAPQGARIAVRLTPRAARDAVEGVSALSDGRMVLLARVRAVPEDGRANDALLRLMAAALALPRSRVTLVEGATSRVKVLHVAGCPETLASRLDALPSVCHAAADTRQP